MGEKKLNGFGFELSFPNSGTAKEPNNPVRLPVWYNLPARDEILSCNHPLNMPLGLFAGVGDIVRLLNVPSCLCMLIGEHAIYA